ncbi:MAG: hypothetical protein ABR576_15610 [Thermoanaerobaculia bacterium]
MTRSRVLSFLLLALAASAFASGQEPTPTPTPTATPGPEETPAQPTGASPAPNYFNPAIAVIGNFLGVAGKNLLENRDSLQMRESEISLQAVVDPFARADFFVAVTDEEVELEEGFITFTSLPADLLVKVGKFKAQIGKVNLMHLHLLPWVDVPLPNENLIGGEEGWNDAGVSVARLFPLPGDTFSELTLQVFRGKSEGLFDAPSRSDLAYLGHYRAYRDFGDDHNVELGATWGRGSNGASEDAETTVENLHLVYRWKPLTGRPYRQFILRSELTRSRREQPEGRQSARGFFVGGDYRLSRRWWAGGRYEFADRADEAAARDRGEAVTLTFWPSEFSQLRAEGRRRRYAGGVTANELLVQLQFSIGAHGAHPF